MAIRNTYVSGLRAALAEAERRADECRKEEARHRSGETSFNPEEDARWEKMERLCAMEAECIAGGIRRLIDESRKTLRED